MGELVEFNGETTLDIPPEKVLAAAASANLKGALVIGEAPDGELYVASSYGDQTQTLWLIELFKHKLLSGEFG